MKTETQDYLDLQSEMQSRLDESVEQTRSASKCAKELRDENLRMQALNAELVAALEHIRYCFWTENEPMSERVDYLQGKAGEALAKAQ